MPRDPRAYLADIVDAAEAIAAAIDDLDLPGYEENRLVRFVAAALRRRRSRGNVSLPEFAPVRAPTAPCPR